MQLLELSKHYSCLLISKLYSKSCDFLYKSPIPYKVNSFFFCISFNASHFLLHILYVLSQQSVLFLRTAIEENPQTFPMTKDETRLSAEILKTLFNISLHLSDTDDSDMLEHCERIVFIVRAMFIHVEPLVHCPESLSNHALNIVSNMPRCCLKHLYWLMPLSVSKKLAKDYDASPSSKRFRIHFEVYINYID